MYIEENLWVCGGFHLPMILHKHNICIFRIAHNFLHSTYYQSSPSLLVCNITCKSISLSLGGVIWSIRIFILASLSCTTCTIVNHFPLGHPSHVCCLWRICDMKTVCVHMICTIVGSYSSFLLSSYFMLTWILSILLHFINICHSIDNQTWIYLPPSSTSALPWQCLL